MAANKIKNVFKSNQISAIYFDLDNTLIPTRKGDSKACIKLAALLQDQHDMTNDIATMCTTKFLKAFRRCPDNPDISLETWRCHLWEQSLPEKYKHLSYEIYKSWLQFRYRYVTLSLEFSNLLQSLRPQYLLGLITNGPSNAQWEKIQRLNLNKFFDCILVSGDLPWEKPDERIFLAACDYLGVQPKHCIMIGDKLETDIQGGIDAKLGGTIWTPLNSDRPAQGVEPFPDIVLHNLLELENLLPQTSIPKLKSFRSRSSETDLCLTFHNRRVASLPDLDSSNSNSSDGS